MLILIYILSCHVVRIVMFFSNLLVQVEVEYSNGSKFNLSSEFLRIHSPAVDGKVRSIGGEKVIFFRIYLLCQF